MSTHSTKHRKISLTASHLTASTATTTATTATAISGATDDGEDSFTELIFRNRRKCVRFGLPPVECYDDGSPSLPAPTSVASSTPASRAKHAADLWYSKKEVQMQRHDVQRTIRALRKHSHCVEGSAHVFLESSPASSSLCQRSPRVSSSSSFDDPPKKDKASGNIGRTARNSGSGGNGDSSSSSEVESARSAESGSSSDNPEICYRGCERYYSLETRFMSQKIVVDAVLDAQARRRKKKDAGGCGGGGEDHGEEELRRLSEEISQPGRELARWHATLNAFHCYGFAGLLLSGPPTSFLSGFVDGEGGGRDPDPGELQPLESKPKIKAHTPLWWKDALTAPGFLPRPLSSSEDEEGVGVEAKQLRPGCEITVATRTIPAPLTPQKQAHRRSTSLPSPPTQYVFAPRHTVAANSVVYASSSNLVSPRS